MRIEAAIWTATAVFFASLAAIYVAVGGEAAGTALLVVAFGFGTLVAAWLWHRTACAPQLAEDRADADAEPGEVGVFVEASWRPVAIAAGATFAVVGLVVGPWMTILGVLVAAFHVLGLARDLR